MKQATKIQILRVEGPSPHDKVRFTANGPDCWQLAHDRLRRMEHTYPADGPGHLHRVTVTWEDGYHHPVSLYLRQPMGDVSIGQSIAETCRYFAGLACPPQVSQEHYMASVGQFDMQLYRKVLEEYDLK